MFGLCQILFLAIEIQLAMKEFTPLTDAKSVFAILSNIPFLVGVSDADREKVFRLLEVGQFKKGEYIVKRGEKLTHVYIIKKGAVNLMLADGDRVAKKCQFNPGDCFGEVAMLSMLDNSASFLAAEHCELIVLSRQALNQLRHEDSHLFSVLVMNLARELARKTAMPG